MALASAPFFADNGGAGTLLQRPEHDFDTESIAMHSTKPLLEETDFPPVFRGSLETLQVNLGYLCNLSCVHCHVNAGPKRTEMMSRETVDQVLAFLSDARIQTLDLTGGAPELNPHFRSLVRSAREADVQVIDRCNLTILFEPDQEDLAQFLADQRVEITASLPCYLEDNVDRQRGRGVFGTSLRALQLLNRLGYGRPGSGLVLNLVFNPQGPVLPPPQEELEAAYEEAVNSGKTEIILDCQALMFLDSEALELIVRMHEELRNRGGALRLIALNDVCKDILVATRLINALHIYKDIHGAIRKWQ